MWHRQLVINHKLFMFVAYTNRHLSNINSLTVRTTCLVCFISIVNGCRKKKPIKTSASSRHITNLEQSILVTFDIYACTACIVVNVLLVAAANILAVKAGTCIGLVCLVCLACLACLSCQPASLTCLVSLPA